MRYVVCTARECGIVALYHDVYDMVTNVAICRCPIESDAQKIANLLEKSRVEEMALREHLMN